MPQQIIGYKYQIPYNFENIVDYIDSSNDNSNVQKYKFFTISEYLDLFGYNYQYRDGTWITEPCDYSNYLPYIFTDNLNFINYLDNLLLKDNIIIKDGFVVNYKDRKNYNNDFYTLHKWQFDVKCNEYKKMQFDGKSTFDYKIKKSKIYLFANDIRNGILDRTAILSGSKIRDLPDGFICFCDSGGVIPNYGLSSDLSFYAISHDLTNITLGAEEYISVEEYSGETGTTWVDKTVTDWNKIFVHHCDGNFLYINYLFTYDDVTTLSRYFYKIDLTNYDATPYLKVLDNTTTDISTVNKIPRLTYFNIDGYDRYFINNDSTTMWCNSDGTVLYNSTETSLITGYNDIFLPFIVNDIFFFMDINGNIRICGDVVKDETNHVYKIDYCSGESGNYYSLTNYNDYTGNISNIFLIKNYDKYDSNLFVGVDEDENKFVLLNLTITKNGFDYDVSFQTLSSFKIMNSKIPDFDNHKFIYSIKINDDILLNYIDEENNKRFILLKNGVGVYYIGDYIYHNFEHQYQYHTPVLIFNNNNLYYNIIDKNLSNEIGENNLEYKHKVKEPITMGF